MWSDRTTDIRREGFDTLDGFRGGSVFEDYFESGEIGSEFDEMFEEMFFRIENRDVLLRQ